MPYNFLNKFVGYVFTLTLFSNSARADWFALNMTEGATAISKEVFDLHMLIFWICVAIGVVVFSVMFYSMFAHTKRKTLLPLLFMKIQKLKLHGLLSHS